MSKAQHTREIVINCICIIIGFALGIVTVNIFNGLPIDTPKQEDKSYVGIFRYEDAKNRVWTIELKEDGTCELAILTNFDQPCTYTVTDNRIHFNELNDSFDAVYGEDGLLYQTHIFKRFK